MNKKFIFALSCLTLSLNLPAKSTEDRDPVLVGRNQVVGLMRDDISPRSLEAIKAVQAADESSILRDHQRATREIQQQREEEEQLRIAMAISLSEAQAAEDNRRKAEEKHKQEAESRIREEENLKKERAAQIEREKRASIERQKAAQEKEFHRRLKRSHAEEIMGIHPKVCALRDQFKQVEAERLRVIEIYAKTYPHEEAATKEKEELDARYFEVKKEFETIAEDERRKLASYLKQFPHKAARKFYSIGSEEALRQDEKRKLSLKLESSLLKFNELNEVMVYQHTLQSFAFRMTYTDKTYDALMGIGGEFLQKKSFEDFKSNRVVVASRLFEVINTLGDLERKLNRAVSTVAFAKEKVDLIPETDKEKKEIAQGIFRDYVVQKDKAERELEDAKVYFKERVTMLAQAMKMVTQEKQVELDRVTDEMADMMIQYFKLVCT